MRGTGGATAPALQHCSNHCGVTYKAYSKGVWGVERQQKRGIIPKGQGWKASPVLGAVQQPPCSTQSGAGSSAAEQRNHKGRRPSLLCCSAGSCSGLRTAELLVNTCQLLINAPSARGKCNNTSSCTAFRAHVGPLARDAMSLLWDLCTGPALPWHPGSYLAEKGSGKLSGAISI